MERKTVSTVSIISGLISFIVIIALISWISILYEKIGSQKIEIELRDKTIGFMLRTIERHQIRENCLSKGGSLQDCKEIVSD